MYSVRTDLALEAKEIVQKEGNLKKIPGVEVEEIEDDEIKVTKVMVMNDEGEKLMKRPKGTYITIDIPKHVHYDSDLMDKVSVFVANEIKGLIKMEDNMTALIVGLGNWKVTPDSLGPKVISKLMITRHLKEMVPDSIDEGIRPVCAISPGVLGITGIETFEIVKGVVDKIKPNLIVCIDALASRKLERVNATIQIGNTGISPGAGIGNHRMEISEKTLGVPVIAIGIPTVVHAATMANDAIDLLLDEMITASDQGSDFYNMLKTIDKGEKQALISKLLDNYVGDIVVTPKDIDIVVESASKVIANGINIALQPALTKEDINKYLN